MINIYVHISTPSQSEKVSQLVAKLPIATVCTKFLKTTQFGIINGEKSPQIYINNFRANKIFTDKSN